MTPLLQQVIKLVGRRADDLDVVAFVSGTLGKKVPDATNDANDTKNVEAKKHGLEMAFSHDVKNDKYPLIPKTKKSFIPYLSLVWLLDKFPHPLPFGLKRGMSPGEITKLLGVEPTPRGSLGPCWARVLDAERDIVLKLDERTYTVGVDEARELSARCEVPSRYVTGLFIAWAAQRNLIDETRVGPHATLFNEVQGGTRRGSELLTAAWPRGLWDVHLADKPGLRDFAYRWFYNIGGVFIRDDLVAVFGGREGSTGHQEPVLDDDSAEAVKKATPALDARFAAWLG